MVFRCSVLLLRCDSFLMLCFTINYIVMVFRCCVLLLLDGFPNAMFAAEVTGLTVRCCDRIPFSFQRGVPLPYTGCLVLEEEIGQQNSHDGEMFLIINRSLAFGSHFEYIRLFFPFTQ